MRHVPWTQHTFRQLKLLLPGAAVTYYLHTLDEFWDVLHGSGGSWAQSVSTSLVYSFTMLTFFLLLRLLIFMLVLLHCLEPLQLLRLCLV